MEKFKVTPEGVCAKEFEFEMEGTMIKSFISTGGCPGNLLGIGTFLKDRDAQEVIVKFEGLNCAARPTSCPDQIAKALKRYLEAQQ